MEGPCPLPPGQPPYTPHRPSCSPAAALTTSGTSHGPTVPGKGALTVNEFVRSPRDDATDRTKREVGEVGAGRSARSEGGHRERAKVWRVFLEVSMKGRPRPSR